MEMEGVSIVESEEKGGCTLYTMPVALSVILSCFHYSCCCFPALLWPSVCSLLMFNTLLHLVLLVLLLLHFGMFWLC